MGEGIPEYTVVSPVFIWLNRKGDAEPMLIRASEVSGALPEPCGALLLHPGGQILVAETPREIAEKLGVR